MARVDPRARMTLSRHAGQAGDGGAGRIRHPIFARFIVKMGAAAPDSQKASHRRELLNGLSGRVIEVGAGNGLNFPYYPETVSELVAVEPEPYLRRHAQKAAEHAAIPIRVIDAVAEALPAPNASFDAGVVSQVLCSVSKPDAALSELFRVIRPGGEIRFYEHVRASGAALRLVQRVADRLIWPRLGGGCHTGRDSLAAIARAGFAIEECRRFDHRLCLLFLPETPHALGRGVRPE